MMSDRRKRRWERLRLWGGMFLVVVVGIGILAYVTYRKALGPPPTPPGKSPEFDQRLADIDKDWLFLFIHEGKVIVSDVFGRTEGVLIDSRDYGMETILTDGDHLTVSPDGRWATLEYWASTWKPAQFLPLKLIMIDLKDWSMRVVTSESSEKGSPSGQVCWMSENTFLIPVGYGQIENASLWLESRTRIYSLFRTDSLRVSEKVELPIRSSILDSKAKSIYNEKSLAMVYLTVDEHDGSEKMMAYDKNGSRPATDEEQRRFWKLAETPVFCCSPLEDLPSIEVQDVKSSPLIGHVLRHLKMKRSVRCKVALDGKAVRVASCQSRHVCPLWDFYHEQDIGLYVWHESSSSNETLAYCMDESGHYRPWTEGQYIGKIPRWKGNGKGPEEQ